MNKKRQKQPRRIDTALLKRQIATNEPENIRSANRTFRRAALTHVERGTDSSVSLSAPALPSCESSSDFDEPALPLFNGLYNFARWLARSEADAEDLVQETYLKAFRSFANFHKLPGLDLSDSEKYLPDFAHQRPKPSYLSVQFRRIAGGFANRFSRSG